jgi:hypothetical protein
MSGERRFTGNTLEFVREKWEPVFPKRQTKTKKSRVCQIQNEPDRLWTLVFTALPDADAVLLRPEML